MSPTPLIRPARCAALLLAAALLALLPGLQPAQAVESHPPKDVKVIGSINRGSDNVAFTGTLLVTTRIIDDPVFNAPLVLEVLIDFANVRGTSSSGSRFVTETQAVVRRPLRATDQVEVIFPYWLADNPATARTARVVIDVSYSPAGGLAYTSRVTAL